MKKEKVAEFGLNQILGVGITLVVLGIALTYGLSVMSDVKNDQTAGTAERNASEAAITGIAKIPAKLPLIVTIIIAVIIIGILVRYLGGMGGKN